MLKTLAIIRHAKSTWDYGPISDYDRPLKEIGITNTLAVCQRLTEKKINPSLIISSPANRALHTALIVARELKFPFEKVQINSVLYSDSDSDIIKMIKALSDDYQTVFIFGHNPTFTQLANTYLKTQIDNVPTSGTVIFDFETTHWSGISKSKVVSETCIFPKKNNNK